MRAWGLSAFLRLVRGVTGSGALAAGALSGLMLAASATPSLAISPFSNFACPGGPLTVPNLGIVPPSSATNVNIAAGQQLAINVVNGASGTIVRTDTGATVINLFTGVTSATIDGPLVVNLNTPDIGGGGGLFDNGRGANMSITFSCNTIGVTPPVPSTTGDVVDGLLNRLDDREIIRMGDLFDNIFGVLEERDGCRVAAPLTDAEFARRAFVYERSLAALAERTQQNIFAGDEPLPDASDEAERRRLACEYQALLGFPDPVGPGLTPIRARGIGMSLANPNIFGAANGMAAGYSNGAPEASFGNGDWTFKAHLDKGFINEVNGVDRQSRIGSLSLLGITPFGEDMALGAGLKIGGASSWQSSPRTQMDSVLLGLDLFAARAFSDDLFAGKYLGYEYGAHRADIAGVGSTFNTHTFKAGASISGSFGWNDFVVSPSIDALLQYRYRPSFLDGAGATVPASDALSFDLSAGKTISRDYYLPEHEVLLSPFLGANLMLKQTWMGSTPGAGVVPPDALRLQLVAGLNAKWDNGMYGSLKADLTAGQSSTMFGFGASLHVPLDNPGGRTLFRAMGSPPPPP